MKKIELYTWSYCPFCVKAKQLLNNKGMEYEEHVIDNDPDKKKELFEKTGQDTVPYIFIDGELIGGCDDLIALNNKGEL